MTLPNRNAVPAAPAMPTTKTYVGQRPGDDDIGDCRVFVYLGQGEAHSLRHAVHHSPTGFEWGYGGSGPADLALSILEDYLAEQEKPIGLYRGYCGERAWALHQPFKWQMIARLPHTRWTITSAQISEWLTAQPADDDTPEA